MSGEAVLEVALPASTPPADALRIRADLAKQTLP